MKNKKSIISTIAGILVAIASAWITIDWKDFHFQKEWPKLALSAVIAVGGLVTKIDITNKKQIE